MPDGIQIPEGYMRDHRGDLIAVKNIRPIDLLETQTVDKIIGHALELRDRIHRFYFHSIDDIDAFLKLAAEKYNAKRGGKKGNLVLTSFDGLRQVRLQVQERVTFGHELHAAKVLIDQCLSEWSEGANDHLRAVVNHAFRVDNDNQLNVSAILDLLRMEIADPTWQRGREALKDSLRSIGTSSYMRFYQRQPGGKWQAISIDIANAAIRRDHAEQTSEAEGGSDE